VQGVTGSGGAAEDGGGWRGSEGSRRRTICDELEEKNRQQEGTAEDRKLDRGRWAREGDAGGELGMATPAVNSRWRRDEMLPASRSNWSSGVDGGAAERHVRRRSW